MSKLNILSLLHLFTWDLVYHLHLKYFINLSDLLCQIFTKCKQGFMCMLLTAILMLRRVQDT
jgi:hypothetical protein